MDVAIHTVTPEALSQFHEGLRNLSDHLGDAHSAEADALGAALFGARPFALGLMAEDASGALLATPMFSTLHGGPGIYVSDLWVDTVARGSGLGRRLLARALDETIWGVPCFLKLAVYADNPDARAVYDRLGFAAQQAETAMVLYGNALDKLKGPMI